MSVLLPGAFLAVGRPDMDWSITAFITGAKTSIEATFDLFHSPGTALERLPLGVMQPKSGRPRDTFGYVGVTVPVPVVDLLEPRVEEAGRFVHQNIPFGGGLLIRSPADSVPRDGTRGALPQDGCPGSDEYDTVRGLSGSRRARRVRLWMAHGR